MTAPVRERVPATPPRAPAGAAWEAIAMHPAAPALIIAAAIVLRAAAAILFAHPLADDPRSYFLMAQGLAERGEWRDAYGQHAFFSAGYPLLLTPFFMFFGSSVATGLGVNLLLAGISAWLVHRLTSRLSGHPGAALIATAAYAVWLPGIWNATSLSKENLSTPLLLGVVLCALHLAGGRHFSRIALLAGLLWGAAILTGGSALALCAGVAVALLLVLRSSGWAAAIRGGAIFVAGAALVLGPWFAATDRMIGQPVLTTNGAFNLYLGHNPAATGKFVSIADTPMGEGWQQRRLELGEAGLAQQLQREALAWIAANPGRTIQLALAKLVYFWAPNIPDAADFAASRTLAALRAIELAQYTAILFLALWALRSRTIARGDKWIVGAALLGFWVIHALAYVIIRYRDPAMPLLIAMGAVPLAAWLRRARTFRRPAHAA